MKLNKGDIIKTNSEIGDQHWKIVLPVTNAMLHSKRGINADHPGLYLFYGMWYGDKIMSTKSYGKIEELPEEDFYYIGHIKNIDLEEFKENC